jgi:hypothetical protein
LARAQQDVFDAERRRRRQEAADRQAARSAIGAARDIGILEPRIKTINQLLKETEEEGESAFDATALGAQAATAAISNFSAAIAQGESALGALQQTAAQVLSTIGGTFLTQAIKGGTLLGLSGGPLGFLGAGLGLAAGGIQSFAHGGVSSGAPAIVGERGPELRIPPEGTRFKSHRKTRAMMDTSALEAEVRALREKMSQREYILPVDETRRKLVENDLHQGEVRGRTTIVNVNNV